MWRGAVALYGLALFQRKLKHMDQQRKLRDNEHKIEFTIRGRSQTTCGSTESARGIKRILADILAWIRTESVTKHERMWATIGSAGTGKSAISVGLSRLLSEQSINKAPFAIHGSVSHIRLLHHEICMASNESDTIKAQFLESLAKSCDDAKLAIKGPFKNLHSLFISLSTLSVPVDGSIYVILIDGLDESPSIASLLTTDTLRAIPSWLRIIATSRPVPGILRRERSSLIHEYDLDTSSSQRTAIAAFINDRFPPILAKRGITGATANELIEALIAKSGSIFIYARLIMDAIKYNDESIPPTVDGIDGLPRDLYDYYHRYFALRWPLKSDDTAPSSYDVARMILETCKPYAFFIDDKRTHATETNIQGALNQLTSFIIWNEEHREYIARHKSFYDWLNQPLPMNPYHIDRRRGMIRWIVYRVMTAFAVPSGFPFTSVPKLMQLLTTWLECEPTAPLLDGTSGGDGYGLHYMPAPFHIELMRALAAERPGRGGISLNLGR